MGKVMITETILRDAHQSQAATRMRTEDMLAACEVLDAAGVDRQVRGEALTLEELCRVADAIYDQE